MPYKWKKYLVNNGYEVELASSFYEATYKDIKIDLNQSKVYFKGNLVDLTSLEYEILVLFIKNPHRVYTRCQLLEMFWEDKDKFVNDNTLTSTIKGFREKLDMEIITTVRGIGYRMD